MTECMDEWMVGWMNGRMNEWMDRRMKERMSEWMKTSHCGTCSACIASDAGLHQLGSSQHGPWVYNPGTQLSPAHVAGSTHT